MTIDSNKPIEFNLGAAGDFNWCTAVRLDEKTVAYKSKAYSSGEPWCLYRAANEESLLALLRNKPEEVVRWINLYRLDETNIQPIPWISRHASDNSFNAGRVAVLKLTYIDGKPVKAELENV